MPSAPSEPCSPPVSWPPGIPSEGVPCAPSGCCPSCPCCRLLVAALLLETLVERLPLEVEDLVELPLEVVHHPTQVELVEAFAPLLPELVQQVAQPLHAAALLLLHAALHQVPQRVLQVAEVHEVVGQRVEHVARVQSGDLLCAVPFRIARYGDHGAP